MTDDKKLEKKSPDILDDVKKIEKFKKAQLLAEAIQEIKDYAKNILILKEKTNYLLEEIGISAEDSKKVIDYVNSLVKLTEKDKKDIRQQAQDTKQEKEEEVEERIKDNPIPYPFVGALTTSTSTSSGPSWSSTMDPKLYDPKLYTAMNMVNTGGAVPTNYSVTLGNNKDFKITI